MPLGSHVGFDSGAAGSKSGRQKGREINRREETPLSANGSAKEEVLRCPCLA